MVLTDEKQLVQGLQNGCDKAFHALVAQFQDKVLHTAMGFVSNLQDAEDIAQTVFVEVYRSISNFRGEAKLSTWIYRITTTKALEFIRAKKRKKRAILQTPEQGLEEQIVKSTADTYNHPGLRLENKERASILHRYIDQLSENQRIAFTLKKIKGLSQKEICSIMGVSEPSVVSLLFRARRNLKMALSDYYENQLI